MDTITHILTGAVMSGPAREKLGWVGPAALLAGSFAPDIDLVVQLFGTDVYFKYHRVLTNSVVGAIAVSLVVALVVWRAAGRGDFKVVFALVLCAYSMHVFMDLTNSYGCKLFWPLSGKWYALDSVFIIDPWITGLLIVSLALMFLKVRAMPVAAVCFILLFSYWGLRFYMHSRAVDYLKAKSPGAVKAGAFPAPVNPFVWHMVTEGRDGFDTGRYNIATREWKDTARYRKMDENDAVAIARSAPTAKVFLDFARFPYVTYEKSGGGWTVYIQDLRFSFRPGDRRFVETVRVGDDGRVLSEGFRY